MPLPVAAEEAEEYLSPQQLAALVEQTRKEMKAAAAALEFERAAELRDRLLVLEQRSLGVQTEGVPLPLARPLTEGKLTTGKRATGTARGYGRAGKAAARSRTSRWQK